MTDELEEIRALLGPIDPALGRPDPSVPDETILRTLVDDNPTGHLRARAARRRRGHPRRALVSCLAVLAVGIGLVVTLQVRSTDRKAGRPPLGERTVVDRIVTGLEAPAGATPTGSTRLLPSGGVTISQLVTHDRPVDSTYQQLYVGNRALNPPQLLVATIDATQDRSGSVLLSQTPARLRQRVQIGSLRANITSAQGESYLWWTEPDGVEVDVTGINLSRSELVAVVKRASPVSKTRLGLTVKGPLPAHLHLVSSAFTAQPDTSLEELAYRQGACDAQLQVFDDVDGHLDMASGSTRLTELFGHQALINTDHGANNLVWNPLPGVAAQLSVPTAGSCSVTTLAQDVHRVTAAQWDETFARLGSKARSIPVTRGLT